jgi:uncharacterized protein with ACT and thioredoxin-like domain
MDQKDAIYPVRELAQGINEIKINTEILVTKLDQLNINLQKLEETQEDIYMSVTEQDRRITILEQVVPANLVGDIALIKQGQKTYSKLLWLIGGGTLTALLKLTLEALTK